MLVGQGGEVLNLFDVLAQDGLLVWREEERDESKEADPLVLLLEQVFGIESVA